MLISKKLFIFLLFLNKYVIIILHTLIKRGYYMKHFLKPAVKLGLLGGVIYVAGNAGLTSLQQTQPVAVAQLTPSTSGPVVIEMKTNSDGIRPEPLTMAEIVVPEVLPVATPIEDVNTIVIAEAETESLAENIPAVSKPEPVEVKSTVVKRQPVQQRYRVAYPLPQRMPQQFYGYQPNFQEYQFPEIPPMPPMPYF
jgi:hypothetical protein